jgi:hypothetical protein
MITAKYNQIQTQQLFYRAVKHVKAGTAPADGHALDVSQEQTPCLRSETYMANRH